MPIVVRDILTGIRERLNLPDRGRLPNWRILMRLWDELDHNRNELNLPNVGRILSPRIITINAGEDETTLPAEIDAEGIVLVQTTSSSDRYHVPREVPSVPIQNADRYYVGPRELSGSVSEPHVAACLTFYRDHVTNLPKVHSTPRHGSSAEYLIWWQSSRPEPPGINQNWPLQDSFVNLVKCRVARGLLSTLIEKNEKGEVVNAKELQILGETISTDCDRYNAIFQEAKQVAIPQQIGARIGWDSAYDDGW